MTGTSEHSVLVLESGNGPYAQFVQVGHHVMGADEPESLGGNDTGPSPYEYVLAGLGACTAMTLRMYAARHRWPLKKITVELRHDVDRLAGSAEAIDRFQRTIRLDGSLSDEQRRRLIEIAERCPVSRTLKRASEVVTLVGADVQPPSA